MAQTDPRAWLADFERIDPDRIGDVLELGLVEIGDREIEPPLDLPIGVLGKTDRARLAKDIGNLRRARNHQEAEKDGAIADFW